MGINDAECAPERGFALDDTRACLRPDRCPFARVAPIAGRPELWARTLTALLPGDPEIALEIVGDLVDGEIGDL